MSYKEQIISKDKYPCKFSPQLEAIVFVILQIFFATPAVLKFPHFKLGNIRHLTRLDQSRASENICWIIISDIPRSAYMFILIIWFKSVLIVPIIRQHNGNKTIGRLSLAPNWLVFFFFNRLGTTIASILKAVLKFGEYHWILPSFSWGILGHVTHFHQSHSSENI